jgi:hypothetical protein
MVRLAIKVIAISTGATMIKFTVASKDVREMKGNAKASGKPYHLFFQNAYAHTLDKSGQLNPFPEKTEIMLETVKDEFGVPVPKVYEPGEYQLHPASIYVDRQGGVAVAPRLVPLAKR